MGKVGLIKARGSFLFGLTDNYLSGLLLTERIKLFILRDLRESGEIGKRTGFRIQPT